MVHVHVHKLYRQGLQTHTHLTERESIEDGHVTLQWSNTRQSLPVLRQSQRLLPKPHPLHHHVPQQSQQRTGLLGGVKHGERAGGAAAVQPMATRGEENTPHLPLMLPAMRNVRIYMYTCTCIIQLGCISGQLGCISGQPGCISGQPGCIRGDSSDTQCTYMYTCTCTTTCSGLHPPLFSQERGGVCVEDRDCSTGEPTGKHLLSWMMTHTQRSLRHTAKVKHLHTIYVIM